MNDQISIRLINASDAGRLSALAKAIYCEYYLHLWYPGGAEWYMDTYAYAVEQLKAELADSNNLHYIVYAQTQMPLGYLKLKINAVLPGFEEMNALEIERIYLHRLAAGKGVGKMLMLLSEEVAREHDKNMIFLKAMDSSHDAIGFYRKMGYTPSGTLVLPFEIMKKEYRGMVILTKTI